MEKLKNGKIIINIDYIKNISGIAGYFEVELLTDDKIEYKMILNHAWDFRVSIENASIDRFCEFRKNLPDDIIENSIYIVENSEYIKYFENQVSGTRPIEFLSHYIICDKIDTTIDVLSEVDPILIKI